LIQPDSRKVALGSDYPSSRTISGLPAVSLLDGCRSRAVINKKCFLSILTHNARKAARATLSDTAANQGRDGEPFAAIAPAQR